MQPLTNASRAGITLSLGMLNLSVSIHAAVGEDTSSALRTVCQHEHAPTPIQQVYRCPVCASEDRSSFVKASASGDGFVAITPEVLAASAAAGEPFKKSLMLSVHPAAEVSSVLLPSGKTYYLSMKAPNKGSRELYSLLVTMVSERTDLAFMSKFSFTGSVTLMQLIVVGGRTLALAAMADAELVREHPVIEPVDLAGHQLELGRLIVDQLCEPFLAGEHGTSRDTIIAAYAATQTPVPAAVAAGVPAAASNVLDMTAALEAMLASIAKPVKVRAPRRPRTAAQKVS